MASDVEHLSRVYLPFIDRLRCNVSSWSFPHFRLGFSFLPLSFDSYLCIPDVSPLSDTGFANIFPVGSFSLHSFNRDFVGAKAFHFG